MSFILSEFLPKNNESFVIRRGQVYHALNDFHSHPELELIYIQEGTGTLIIDETVIPLAGGELILIGCNVPHMFRFQDQTFKDTILRRGEKPAQLNHLLLHFDPLVIGENFVNIPENSAIKLLLRRAENGLLIEGGEKEQILLKMEELINTPLHNRLIGLITLLNYIAAGNHRPATVKKNKPGYQKSDERRMSAIFLATINDFHKRIKLKDMADSVYMTPNAFCNYFKQKTGRTYFDFLLEVRVNHACKLLRIRDYSVNDVCHFSGFTNISNFNRQFKELIGQTPLDYRKTYKQRY